MRVHQKLKLNHGIDDSTTYNTPFSNGNIVNNVSREENEFYPMYNFERRTKSDKRCGEYLKSNIKAYKDEPSIHTHTIPRSQPPTNLYVFDLFLGYT
ncbi:10472_t:CDS:2 [Funneliformis caledonium]|uniref:10472_t:CDS:1 n=1 Tax=Funneliformis caledonium TaxID=1117310 RepID=A0A9N9GM44_9GLOM|nr:10472_t:CDS:2 [Funneliformis caledonium]